MSKQNTALGQNIERLESSLKLKQAILSNHKKQPFLSEDGIIIQAQIDIIKGELSENKKLLEVEKEQKLDDYIDGHGDCHVRHDRTTEEWFNEKYGTDGK